jgi:uncharacterized surface protein with fasciclin (FAS1) repeats
MGARSAVTTVVAQATKNPLSASGDKQMTTIKQTSTLLGCALGTFAVSQLALAGPGCPYGAKEAGARSDGYQPAIYEPASDVYPAARVYRTGMGYGDERHTSASRMAGPDIVDTAIAAGSFDTLVTAVKAAGLVDTLKGQGPFTVFAPTDDAFAKLPKAQLDALLSDKAALTKVLTYHVVPGKVEAADVVTMTSASTVEGQSLKISVGDSVMVNNAKVIKTDIDTSNGVIHVIDSVMLPPDMVSQR